MLSRRCGDSATMYTRFSRLLVRQKGWHPSCVFAGESARSRLLLLYLSSDAPVIAESAEQLGLLTFAAILSTVPALLIVLGVLWENKLNLLETVPLPSTSYDEHSSHTPRANALEADSCR